MPGLRPLGKALERTGLSGIILTSVASLGCCAPAAVAPLAAVISSIGLGFLADLAVAVPLLYGTVGILLLGLGLSWRHHGRPEPLLLAMVGGTALLYPYHTALDVPVFIAVVLSGQVLLGTASILNFLLLRRMKGRLQARQE